MRIGQYNNYTMNMSLLKSGMGTPAILLVPDNAGWTLSSTKKEGARSLEFSTIYNKAWQEAEKESTLKH